MSTLQEVLAVLLGAESEAKRIVDDSKNESEKFIQSSEDKFAKDRTNQIASARSQAKEVMETALNAAKTEAVQIAELGKEERKRMQKRYEENIGPLVEAMATEIAEGYKKKGS
jgi:vacuolar-type H+-ATPase subunit H